jgi:hypothetical protein
MAYIADIEINGPRMNVCWGRAPKKMSPEEVKASHQVTPESLDEGHSERWYSF